MKKLNTLKKLLFTLALIVSFVSFGQSKDSSFLYLPQPSLALKDYNEKGGVYQVSKNETFNIFNKLYVKSNFVKGVKYFVGWKDYEKKIPRLINVDNMEYEIVSIKIYLRNNTWDVVNLDNPPESLTKQLNNLKKGDLIVINDANGKLKMGLEMPVSGVIIEVAD